MSHEMLVPFGMGAGVALSLISSRPLVVGAVALGTVLVMQAADEGAAPLAAPPVAPAAPRQLPTDPSELPGRYSLAERSVTRDKREYPIARANATSNFYKTYENPTPRMAPGRSRVLEK